MTCWLMLGLTSELELISNVEKIHAKNLHFFRLSASSTSSTVFMPFIVHNPFFRLVFLLSCIILLLLYTYSRGFTLTFEVQSIYVPPSSASPHLKDLCSRTQWRQDKFLWCHSNCGPNPASNPQICGGLSNARNRIQTCLRLAIDAGLGLIIAPISRRADKDLETGLDVDGDCESEYFDIDHLSSVLADSCPQLQLRRCSDHTGIDNRITAPGRGYKDATYPDHGNFSALIEQTLSEHPSQSTSIAFSDPFLAWNY